MTLTLKAAITATQTTIDVNGADTLRVGSYRQLADEVILIRAADPRTLQPGETAWQRLTVDRGIENTEGVVHAAGVTMAAYSGGGGEGGVTINLTGTETEPGNFFRGDEDPADTPAYLAILEAGDIWTDTSFGPPYALKTRNSGNDGWDIAQLIVYDDAGVTIGQAFFNAASGQFTVSAGAPSGAVVGLWPTGQVDIAGGDSNWGSSIKINTDGKIELEASGESNAGTITLKGTAGAGSELKLDDVGVLTHGGNPVFAPSSVPIVPLTTPDAQDVIDALVALGLITQSD